MGVPSFTKQVKTKGLLGSYFSEHFLLVSYYVSSYF